MLAKLCCFYIRQYWKFIPEEKRQVCLYKESCSRYIYRIFQEQGFLRGLEAVKYRFKNCHKNYSFIFNNNTIYLETRNGDHIKRESINPEILNTFQVVLQKNFLP
jgi:uncharacterized protein